MTEAESERIVDPKKMVKIHDRRLLAASRNGLCGSTG
jgi:hypothetical protein